MEQEAQPRQGNQPQLIEQELGDHGTTPLPQVVKEGYSTRFLQVSELAAAYRYKTGF